MKRILLSLAMIALVGSATVGATRAYFSDSETSLGNTFTAGSIDLKIDGGDVNVFHTFGNMKPGSQPNFAWVLKNAGSVAGHLTINNIGIVSNENSCLEPETAAGDVTCTDPGAGELSSVLNYRIMLDKNCDGWLQTGDVVLFEGMANSMASSYDTGVNLAPGEQVCVNSLVNWWSTANDNKAQGDDMKADFTFNLQSI